MQALHLTKAERKLFDALPAGLREGWEVMEEEGTAYETPEELRIRATTASFSNRPEIAALAQRIAKGEKMENLSLDAIPQVVLEEFLFTIGASGVTVLVSMLLKEAKTDQDLEGLAGLTMVRHALLASNAEISYAS